jgi:hypothetical protein
MIGRELDWRRGVFAVNPGLIAAHVPLLLLIGTRHQAGHPAEAINRGDD